MAMAVCAGGDPLPLYLGPWLKPCRWIIAADGGLVQIQRWGLRATHVIGDLDSWPTAEPWQNWASQRISLSPEKDETDTDAAVHLAHQLSPEPIWLFGGTGGRTDHWLSNLRLLEQQPTIERWITPLEDIRILQPGQALSMTPGFVSIFPLGPGPWRVRDSGFQWPLNRVNFRVWHSLSNRVLEPGASLTVTRGRLMVFRHHTAEPIEEYREFNL